MSTTIEFYNKIIGVVFTGILNFQHMISAIITFKVEAAPEQFIFHRTAEGKPHVWPSADNPVFSGRSWRMLADDSAVELVPLCDSDARKVDSIPLFNRLEIWPVQWGYPDSLVTEHPAEVEQMRQDHLAGKHDLIDGNYDWPFWLSTFGKQQLWMEFRTQEMERHWLSKMTSPGSNLFALASLGAKNSVRADALNYIRYRADFHNGSNCVSIWLASCGTSLLSAEEIKVLPGYAVVQTKLLDQQEKALTAQDGLAASVGKLGRDIESVVRGQKQLLAMGSVTTASEPVSDDEARRLFALVTALESNANFRKAPILRVFQLYCLEGLTRDEVAKACKCSPALVTLRLQAIEQKLGRKPAELRIISDQFERVADSLTDSRANHIHRGRAIEGEDPNDED